MGQRIVRKDPLPSRPPQIIPLEADPLLISYQGGDMEKHLNSRWRRWRFRNKPDHFKIARMEAELGLPPTTDPADWEF